MSGFTTEESKEPESYSNSYLHGLKATRNISLTQRKLNSEFLNIKNLVMNANSSGQTSIKYIYNYINNASTKDYFVDLLTKIATFFPDSNISYILNTNIDITTAITTEDISIKAESALNVLMDLTTNDDLKTGLVKSLEAVEKTKNAAIEERQKLSEQHYSTPNSNMGFIPLVRTSLNNDLVEYNSSNSNNSTINIIQIDWSAI